MEKAAYEDLYDLQSSPHIIRRIRSRRIRWAGHVVRMAEWRGAYKVLVGKLERKRQLGRPRCRWEDNIKIDLQEGGWGMKGIDLAQDKENNGFL